VSIKIKIIMKKLFTVAVLTTLCFFSVEKINAQAFEKGQKNFSVGVGAGYGIGANATVDYGVSDLISVGIIGAVSSYSYGYGLLGSNFRLTYIGVGGRGAVHFGKYLKEIGINEEKLDPYIGGVGGVRLARYSSDYSSFYTEANVRPMIGGFLGARYYFKEKMAVYAEAGTPYSSLGISIKF
jgi:hypothetical protein